MKSRFTRWSIYAFVLFVGCRYGYKAWTHWVSPVATSVSDALVGQPVELSSFGHDLTASLQRTQEWQLVADDSLVHQPDRQLRVDPLYDWQENRRRMFNNTVQVYLNSRDVGKLFNRADLEQIEKAAERTVRVLRETKNAEEQSDLKAVLQPTTLPGGDK